MMDGWMDGYFCITEFFYTVYRVLSLLEGDHSLCSKPVVMELGLSDSQTQLTEEDRFNPSSKSCCLKRCPFIPFFSSYFAASVCVSTELLPAGETATAVLGIDFCDSTQAANFQLW